jgi:hypothetical protein
LMLIKVVNYLAKKYLQLTTIIYGFLGQIKDLCYFTTIYY